MKPPKAYVRVSARTSPSWATPRATNILLPCIYRNRFSLAQERVATLHPKHAFVICAQARPKWRFRSTSKTPSGSCLQIDDVTFNIRRCLMECPSSVAGCFMNSGKYSCREYYCTYAVNSLKSGDSFKISKARHLRNHGRSVFAPALSERT